MVAAGISRRAPASRANKSTQTPWPPQRTHAGAKAKFKPLEFNEIHAAGDTAIRSEPSEGCGRTRRWLEYCPRMRAQHGVGRGA